MEQQAWLLVNIKLKSPLGTDKFLSDVNVWGLGYDLKIANSRDWSLTVQLICLGLITWFGHHPNYSLFSFLKNGFERVEKRKNGPEI